MSTFSYHADFQPALPKVDAHRYLKKWFATAQKSFLLLPGSGIIMINIEWLSLLLSRQKTFDSPLTNHFSRVMQNFRYVLCNKYWCGYKGSSNFF